MSGKLPKARQKNLVVQDFNDEVLLYDLVENRAFCLNETAPAVWRNCDGRKSVDTIADSLTRDWGKNVGTDLVWLAIDDLHKKGLVEDIPATPSNISGLTRRDAIKSIGMGAIVALPVVTALVAPTAVYANSACMTGGTCTCDTVSANMSGQICNPVTPCTDTNCRCAWANNGNANGTCVV